MLYPYGWFVGVENRILIHRDRIYCSILSRGLGEAFGHEIISWEIEIFAQMLHPYGWFVTINCQLSTVNCQLSTVNCLTVND